MIHIRSDDGRILTPPKELEPLLKNTFPTFSKLLGHIRFFYLADEIWDGTSSLIFSADGEQLAAVTLDDGIFHIQTGDDHYKIADEALLDAVYTSLKKVIPANRHRPFEQLTMNLNDPNQFSCGRRCDMCLGSKNSSNDNYSESENFGYLNWICYCNCISGINIGRWDGVFVCPGCVETRKTKDCRYFACPTEKGYANCAECGAYHSCDVYRNSHYPGECNLGLTAQEVTSLVMPYCVKERLDIWRETYPARREKAQHGAG